MSGDDTDKIRLVMAFRHYGISDPRLMERVEQVPFGMFGDDPFVNELFDAKSRQNSPAQPMARPLVAAMMCNELKVGERMKVLEVGTGSGYQTAILSGLARRVYTLTADASAIKPREQLFERLKLRNITQMAGSLDKGWPQQAPFERIILNRAVNAVPTVLFDQLADDGILVAPVGFFEGHNQLVKKFERHGDQIVSTDLFPVRFVPRS